MWVLDDCTANANLTLHCRVYNKRDYTVSVYETVTVFRALYRNLRNLIEPNEENRVK